MIFMMTFLAGLPSASSGQESPAPRTDELRHVRRTKVLRHDEALGHDFTLHVE
jgi:hypothetical protein